MWTRCFRGFLASAAPGDAIVFAPELLPARLGYARRLRDAGGNWREESDRWTDALRLCEIARDAFGRAASLR